MLPVALITFLEGLRSRVLYGIFVFSLLVMLMSIVFSNFFMHQIGKVAIDFNLSAISFAGILISLSISVNLIYKDLDKKTIYFVISKPISRSEYIYGKYLGLMMVLFTSFIVLTCVSCFTIFYLKLNYENFFLDFSWMAYFQAIYFDFVKYAVFNSIIILLGAVGSSSFLTMFFSLSVYIIGQTITEVVNFISIKVSGVDIDSSVRGVIDVVKYIVPNLSAFDFKLISAHGMLLSHEEFLVFSGYGLVYTLIMLYCASMIFKRKEVL